MKSNIPQKYDGVKKRRNGEWVFIAFKISILQKYKNCTFVP